MGGMTASGPPDVETLLAHEGFVRGLARQLVTGDAEVDDVVQQTFVAALEHPPRSEGGLRGWLATVVRNVVRQGYRAKGRRARRERVAARPEGVPSTADLLAREVARRTVVEAVVALDEPYRAAIVLRYLEGLPPRDVAARLGVPVETARTRVKRGLVLLRARLDERHRGDRRAWMAVVLPLAGGGPAAGPAADPASASAAPVAAASSRGPVLVAAGLVIAVGGGVAWWAGAGSDAPAPAPTPRTTAWLAPTRGPDADRAPPVPAPAPSLAPAPRPTAWVAAPRPAASLRGVVVGDGRRTVPGAEVRARADDDAAAADVRTTTTDASGQFAFDGLAAGAWRLRVRAPDGRGADTTRVARADGAPTLVVLSPPPVRMVFTFHVEDGAGRPVEGADVTWIPDVETPERQTVTDRRGNARLPLRATGPRVHGTVVARHRAGVASVRCELRPLADGPRPHARLVLAAPGTVEGRVVGPDGVAVDAALVVAVAAGDPRRAGAFAPVNGGRFEVSGLPAGAYDLSVEAPPATGLATDGAALRVEVAPGARVVTSLALGRGTVVRGRVVGGRDGSASDGVPLGDASVTLRRADVADAAPRTARTDADGTYTFHGATRGARYDVEIVPAGPFASARASFVADGGPPLEHRLGPGGAVDLVTDARTPFVVRRDGDAEGLVTVPPAGEGVAAVRLEHLAVGRWTAALVADGRDGLRLGSFEVEAGRAAWLDTTAGAPVVLRGRVTRAGAPVAGAVVAGLGPALAVTDAAGAYEMRGPVGARVPLDVVATAPEPDAVAARRAATCMGLGTSEGAVVVQDFELGAGRWVLAVVDAAGRPVEGAEVRLRYADTLDPATSPRRTDATGRATWSAVPEGATATADVEGPDGAVAHAALPAASSAPPVVTATLAPAARVRLRVVDADGLPAVGARVEVSRTGDGAGAVRVLCDIEAKDGTWEGALPAEGDRLRARRRDVASGAEVVSPWVATADVVRDPSSGTLRLP